MTNKHLTALIIGAASFMFINILMGTLGAHLWQDRLLAHNGVTNFATARDYLAMHALAVLCLAVLADRYPHARLHLVAWLQLIGVTLFSGSLMLYALTGIKWLSQITPLGGSTLLVSWLLVAWRATKLRPKP